jgi:bifunctional enzyme CysN/CysC
MLSRSPKSRADSPAVNREARAALKHQRPAVLWLSGAEEVAARNIAKLVDERLYLRKCHAFLLDDDGPFGRANRIRIDRIVRLCEMAKLMTDAGLIVITAFTLLSRAERQLVCGMLAPGEFIEVFIDTQLDAAGRAGSTDGAEAPAHRVISIDSALIGPNQAVSLIMDALFSAPIRLPAPVNGTVLPFDMSYS